MNIFKRFGDYLAAIFKLGKTARRAGYAERMARRVPDIESRVAEIDDKSNDAINRTINLDIRLTEQAHLFERHRREMPEIVARHARPVLAEVQGRQAELALGQTEMTRRLDRLFERGGAAPEPAAAPMRGPERTETPGFDALRQAFYHRLENKYRGSLEDIRAKLRVHLPEVEAAFLRTGEDKRVLDLGCGRGEWLGLLAALDVPAWGVDLNAHQIEQARADGYDAQLADAIATLEAAPDKSHAAITAFHLIEHLPFDTVLWIAREALRVLAPGGVLLFETPNVRNVLVGATSFHNDPTHIAPRTDAVMSVVFETCGFEAIDARFLNAHERLEEFRTRLDDELAYLLFGPQDLAISGRKPLKAA